MIFEGKMIGFIPTSNPARARLFYEDVLAMRFVSDDTFALVMDANGTQIRIVPVGPFTPAPFTLTGWEVVGIDALVQRMCVAGVVFERFGLPGQREDGIWAAPSGARVAWFKDPDGNILSISQHP